MNEVEPSRFDARELSTTRPAPTLGRLFFSDEGLRAGWSVLLFLLLAVVSGLAITALVRFGHLLPKLPKEQVPDLTPRNTLLQESVSLLIFLVPAWLMSRIERRPFTRYGFAWTNALKDLLMGLFWGFVNLTLLIAALYLVHGLRFDGVSLQGAAALDSGLEWFAAFLLVGLFEEFLTRGYLQYTVSRGVASIVRAVDPANRYAHAIGFWIAAFLFSFLLFTAGHLGNPGENAAGIFAVGLAGLVLVFSLWRTGALWWAIGWHCAWDWTQTCLFGTPDSGQVARLHLLSTHPVGDPLYSGGTAGPEGSVLVIPALLLAALVIHITLPRRNYPLTRDQAPPDAAIEHGTHSPAV